MYQGPHVGEEGSLCVTHPAIPSTLFLEVPTATNTWLVDKLHVCMRIRLSGIRPPGDVVTFNQTARGPVLMCLSEWTALVRTRRTSHPSLDPFVLLSLPALPETPACTQRWRWALGPGFPVFSSGWLLNKKTVFLTPAPASQAGSWTWVRCHLQVCPLPRQHPGAGQSSVWEEARAPPAEGGCLVSVSGWG